MYSPITKFHVVDQLAAAGAIVTLLLSVQCYGQVFVCDRLPNTDEISAPVAQLESRKSVGMANPSLCFQHYLQQTGTFYLPCSTWLESATAVQL